MHNHTQSQIDTTHQMVSAVSEYSSMNILTQVILPTTILVNEQTMVSLKTEMVQLVIKDKWNSPSSKTLEKTSSIAIDIEPFLNRQLPITKIWKSGLLEKCTVIFNSKRALFSMGESTVGNHYQSSIDSRIRYVIPSFVESATDMFQLMVSDIIVQLSNDITVMFHITDKPDVPGSVKTYDAKLLGIIKEWSNPLTYQLRCMIAMEGMTYQLICHEHKITNIVFNRAIVDDTTHEQLVGSLRWIQLLCHVSILLPRLSNSVNTSRIEKLHISQFGHMIYRTLEKCNNRDHSIHFENNDTIINHMPGFHITSDVIQQDSDKFIAHIPLCQTNLTNIDYRCDSDDTIIGTYDNESITNNAIVTDGKECDFSIAIITDVMNEYKELVEFEKSEAERVEMQRQVEQETIQNQKLRESQLEEEKKWKQKCRYFLYAFVILILAILGVYAVPLISKNNQNK